MRLVEAVVREALQQVEEPVGFRLPKALPSAPAWKMARCCTILDLLLPMARLAEVGLTEAVALTAWAICMICSW